jgi:hypothetical protein
MLSDQLHRWPTFTHTVGIEKALIDAAVRIPKFVALAVFDFRSAADAINAMLTNRSSWCHPFHGYLRLPEVSPGISFAFSSPGMGPFEKVCSCVRAVPRIRTPRKRDSDKEGNPVSLAGIRAPGARLRGSVAGRAPVGSNSKCAFRHDNSDMVWTKYGLDASPMMIVAVFLTPSTKLLTLDQAITVLSSPPLAAEMDSTLLIRMKQWIMEDRVFLNVKRRKVSY